MTEPPDLVYVVRPGESNPSLKYSLRSLANLPHRRVFVAGHCPSFVKNVTKIPVRKLPNKLASIEANLRAALRHPELGERAVYMNDDFYVMEPIDEVPITHGGPVSEFALRQEFKWRMARTIDEFVIQGMRVQFDGMLTYDGVHMPLPIETSIARGCLANMPSGVLWRTWYGNVAAIGGTRVSNTKSQKGEVVPGPFMSTSQVSLRPLREYLEDVLPKESPYV
jgi:hypothetical protein